MESRLRTADGGTICSLSRQTRLPGVIFAFVVSAAADCSSVVGSQLRSNDVVRMEDPCTPMHVAGGEAGEDGAGRWEDGG